MRCPCAALLSLIRDSGRSKSKIFSKTFFLPQIYNNSIAHREGFRHGFYHPSGTFAGTFRCRGRSYVSGQQLAEQLGVSRAAVHKAAAALPRRGYALEAASRRGYRLARRRPLLRRSHRGLPCPICIYMTRWKAPTGRPSCWHWAVPHGTLVLAARAERRTRRLGRRFESPAGKGRLLLGAAAPEMPAANAQTATIGAAVAVCRAVQTLCGLELAIKWVNDLYYQGQKGLRHPDGSRDRHGERPAGMAGSGHRPQPDRLPCRLARGAGLQSREPVPRRACPGEPGCWPGPLPGSCWPSARRLTVWMSTAPVLLCPATG